MPRVSIGVVTAATILTAASIVLAQPPTVSVNAALGQPDPTSQSPILFTAVFSEPVVDLEGSDVDLSGSAGATTAEVSGGPSIYTIAVSGMTQSGQVVASLPAGAARDAEDNPSEASTSLDNTVTFVLGVASVPALGAPGLLGLATLLGVAGAVALRRLHR